MPEVRLYRGRIADGEEARLREWFAELAEREDEVVETLEHEGVYTETVFIRSTEGGSYLYGYMEAEDLEAAHAAGAEEAFEVDREHHAVLEAALAGPMEPLETIGHFTNPSRR